MTARIYEGHELHLHVGGAIGASLVPWWLHWFRDSHPDVILNVSITRSARRFVSPTAVRHLVNGRTWTDAWSESVPTDVSAGLSAASECIILFPATLDTLMRLASGRTDSPALMMLQLTTLPVVIADSLPGGNPLVDKHLAELGLRTNLAFAPRVVGIRAHDRSLATSGLNFPGAITTANTMVSALVDGAHHD